MEVDPLMGRQFILIDQSIEDSSGHYLEYARCVLCAAKYEGFRTVLAVNQRSQNLDCPEADLILKPFSKTFWENQTQSKLRSVTGLFLNKTSMASPPGYSANFAEELVKLFRQANCTEGDVVFVPTLSGTELMGISLYSALRDAVPLRWHLLFRRDVSSSHSWFDLRKRVLKWQFKVVFIRANQAFLRGERFFYTDTEELTSQYQCFGIGEFNTLHIPLDDKLGIKPLWDQGHFIVTYLGDLRAEKGAYLLPRIIKLLRQKGFDSSKVLFRIQENIPKGAKKLLTFWVKKILLSKISDGIELLSGPLNNREYRNLLLDSDVVLLPYSSKNYAARSSGIFAEAVAAGIPTIHPLDSWMGRSAENLSINGYVKVKQIADKLTAVLQDYQHHEKISREFSKTWRRKHSAKILIQSLINK